MLAPELFLPYVVEAMPELTNVPTAHNAALAPTLLRAGWHSNGVQLVWQPPTDPLFAYCEVYEGTGNDISQATRLGTINAPPFIRALPLPPCSSGVYYYWLVAVNTLGEYIGQTPAAMFSAHTPRQHVPDALAKVYFHCTQCNKQVPSVKFIGAGWEWSYILRCHNEVLHMEVPSRNARTATPEAPLVVNVFQEEGQGPDDGRPNVQFHCRECNAISADFAYQRDPMRKDHVFVVVCSGKKCAGEKHTVRYGEAALAERDAWGTPTPIVLPINAKLLGQTVAKPPPVPVHYVQRQVRKLRLE